MTLREAIAAFLREEKTAKTISEIADAINKKQSYQKKDGSLVDTFQIHGRTKNYPHLFKTVGNSVSLIDLVHIVKKPVFAKVMPAIYSSESIERFASFEDELFNEGHFKKISAIEVLNLKNQPGIYCIRIANIITLPIQFANVLVERKHNILYIGIATTCLHTRFINQELHAKGHGTFFRSIGAILGYKPEAGSLALSKNKRNYKFAAIDEKLIVEWIKENLIVNWIKLDQNLEIEESNLILKYKPLLNISKNPLSLSLVSQLRAECVKIANQQNNQQ